MRLELAAIIGIALLAGCDRSSSQSGVERDSEGDPKDLTIGVAEQLAAEKLSKKFAIEKLAIESAYIEKLEHQNWRTEKDGHQCIVVEFYDPVEFGPRPDYGYSRPMGGFPAFFSVTVDIEANRVVSHYASSE